MSYDSYRGVAGFCINLALPFTPGLQYHIGRARQITRWLLNCDCF